jgi:hypothetical protein
MLHQMGRTGAVSLPEHLERRLVAYKAAGAIVLIGIWGWFALVRGDQTPVFVYLNIAVHEVGHVVFRPFGELVMLVMGSGSEVLFPLLVGIYFLLRRRDAVAGAICFGWCASALASAATYIADADDGLLPLLGATGPDAAGDWERILGPGFFDKVFLADRIAGVVRTAGFALWFLALGLAVAALVLSLRRAAAAERAGRPQPTAMPARDLAPLSDEEMWG